MQDFKIHKHAHHIMNFEVSLKSMYADHQTALPQCVTHTSVDLNCEWVKKLSLGKQITLAGG